MKHAHTTVELPHAQTVFKGLRSHLSEHGIMPVLEDARRFRIEIEGNVLEINWAQQAMFFNIQAVNDNALYFIRESVVEHLAEFAPDAAEELTWEGGPVESRTPPNFQELSLVRTSFPMEGLIRLSFATPDVGKLANDGMHVRLMLPANRSMTPIWPSVAANGRTVWPRGENKLHLRYYTIRSARADVGEVDIDVVRHDGGVVSDWAFAASPGDRIGVMGPGGGTTPGITQNLFIAGDPTALPAMARMLEELGRDATGHVVCGIPDGADVGDYFPETGLDIAVYPDSQFRARFDELVLTPARESNPAFVWYAGEQQTFRQMRDLCRGLLALPEQRRHITSYWKEGARGDEPM